MLLLAAVLIGVGSAWADTVTFTAGTDTNEEKSITKDGITVSFSNGVFNRTDNYRCYANASMTISSTVGDITQIDFTATASNPMTNFSGAPDKGSWKDANKKQWTGNASEINFGTTTAQVRITEIVVTYTPSNATATTLTIDAKGITNTDVYTSKAAGTLTATVAAGETTLTDPAITWSSSNEDVATVDANGAVTLVAAGTTTITASYAGEDGQYRASSATYELTVTDSTPETTLTIDDSGITNTDVYTSTVAGTLTATVAAGETTLTNPAITWSSSNGDVATVDANGAVTLVAAGTTTITASYAGEKDQYRASSATYELTVTDSTPGETIDFTKQGYSNQQEIKTVSGKNCTITFDKGTNSNAPKYFTTGTAVRAYGGNTFTVSSTNYNINKIIITFSSSGDGENAITVSEGTYEDGTWTGNAQSVTFTIDGTSGHRRIASITVTYADESDTRIATTVTIDATGITNTDVHTSTEAGTLTATVSAGETALTGAAIAWSSSNESVATVDANGTVTLVAAGTTTITASYAGEKDQYRASSATYELTVTDSTPGETIDFTKQGYSNQQEITTASGQNCTITFDQGTSSYAPTYYDTGTAIRAYGGNTFTVSSTTKTIIKITITFSSGGGTNEITASEGTYAEGTWKGNAQSVTFTIGGTTGHRRIASITVTYADIPQNYRLFTGELVEGDYIIYFYDDQDLQGHVMNNTTVSNSRLQYKYGMEVEPDADKVISTNDATIVWHIAKSGEYWTIYNAAANAYAASTGNKEEARMLADGTDDKALWTVTRTGTGTYEFVNKKNAADEVDANLRNNGTDGFACYAPGIGGALSLYKRASVTVTDAGWATYITEENVHFGNDVNAYIVTGYTETSVKLTKVKDVVKGTPVIVNANAGTYVLENAFEVDEVGDNKLVVYHAEDGLQQGNFFVLAKDGESACFKLWVGNNDDLDGRVVLPLTNPNGVRALSIVFGDTTTGIETVSHATPTMSEGAYTLSGQRVQKPTKGLYIIGGKKVVVK